VIARAGGTVVRTHTSVESITTNTRRSECLCVYVYTCTPVPIDISSVDGESPFDRLWRRIWALRRARASSTVGVPRSHTVPTDNGMNGLRDAAVQVGSEYNICLVIVGHESQF
jgi:hypothetical protein